MKKLVLTFCLALTAALSLNASYYLFYGTTTGTAFGNTETSNEGGVTLISDGNSIDTLSFHIRPFGVGDITFYGVHSATSGNITVYSAERVINLGSLGTQRTLLFARTTGEYMTSIITVPSLDIIFTFNNVYNHFQLPNSDMESWTNSNGEPDRWHGFNTATGTWAWAAPALLGQSDDIHAGASGQFSAMITAKSAFGTIANGTMTNGRLNAGATSATSTSNNASMSESNGDDYYMPLYAKPDKFNVWLKYAQGTSNANNKASVSVKTFDGTYYQEPVDKTYTNLSGSIVGGEITSGDWTFYSFPFDYDSYAANNAESKAIFVTFSTNANPGQGSANDKLYIDDIELVYLAAMTDLRYQGVTIEGWDPTVTTYSMEMAGEPNLDDFTATIEGASAVLTKQMEQNEDGSYRIAISVVSGDLQTAKCYIINVSAPAGKKGDVDDNGIVNISDVTVLITHVLSGTNTINENNADMDGNGIINVTDVTMLISAVMSN